MFLKRKPSTNDRIVWIRKQRNSLSGATLSVNSTMNGDSGNASQDEHEEDQEHYFDKLQRFKRTENEVTIFPSPSMSIDVLCLFVFQKAQAPFVRPTKKLNLSQKWEQMMANKANNIPGTDDEEKL